ncbi:TonB-dependent receptor [Thiomicrorhabdus indica]|uniref:TonB-dependent receptor n=1 Tax=Thiomicrorhabdus indica TaxID=2267253 RepID=UPI002AA80105|nr:TonB-dependent receptor [Thiomicrorhabdus indica]
MQRKPLIAALVLAYAPVTVFAETTTQKSATNTNPNTTLENITISASPIHEHDAFEVPSQIDVLSGDDKMSKDSGSLGEMLEDIPGVNNLSAGSQSGKPVIRGLMGDRVKVLSNGAGMDDQAYGTRHLPNVDAYLADRVEVVRGPQSVLYGSDALGGVVNVLSPRVPFGQPTHGEVATEYNTNNNEKHFGAKVGGGNANWGITAGVSIREGDNFETADSSTASSPTPSSPADSRPLFVGEVPNTNFENKAAHIGLGYQNDDMQVILRHTHWQADQNYLGITASTPMSSFEPVATGQALENDETQLSAEFYQGDWVFKPSWVYTSNSREASHDMPFETMAEEKGEEGYLDLEVKRHDWKFAAEHPKLGDFEGEVGFEVSKKEQRLLSGHLTPSADVDKKAVYLFEEADYDQWLVQFGARYDWVDVSAPLDGNNEHFTEEAGIFDASNNERDFAVWSGSLGATYRLNDNWSLAGNLARGFRAPSIFELYAGGEHGGVQAYQIGNPDLEEEIALNADLSLRWKSEQTAMVATVYQNTIDNYIYLANTGFYRAKEGAPNEGERVDQTAPGAIAEMQAEQTDATIRGFEFSLDHKWTPQWQTNLALEIIDGENDKTGQDLPLIPANNLRAAVSYLPSDFMALKKQKLTLEGKFVASKDAVFPFEPFSQFDKMSVGTASTNAYNLWNLRYSAQLPLDKQNLQLAFSVENLFDKDYVDFLDTYKGYALAQGRNVKLNLRMDF